MESKSVTIKGIYAGMLIGLGCIAYLSCDNKYIGAVLFSIALMGICYLQYSLYTGMICNAKSSTDYAEAMLALFGNMCGCSIMCVLAQLCGLNIFDKADQIATAKLMQPWYNTLGRGILCEICIYVAVKVWVKHKSMLGVLIGVPTFILIGGEHCVADYFYMLAAPSVGIKGFVYYLMCYTGNTLGAFIMNAFSFNNIERNITL